MTSRSARSSNTALGDRNIENGSVSVFEHTLLRALAQNVPHRVYAKDMDGRFIFANDAVARGMGVCGPDELLGKTDFDFYPLELATEYHRQEQEVLRHGRSLLNQEEHAKYLLLEAEAWLVTTKVAVRNEVGEIIGLVGINYEITAQKKAELALQSAHAAAADEISSILVYGEVGAREIEGGGGFS